MKHYNSYRTALSLRFGKPVRKVPINGGFSCPNRDGSKSRLGCIFCDNRSFSPVAVNTEATTKQLTNAIDREKSDVLFLPYLQPFSNTYGTVEYLRSIYESLIRIPRVVGLAIGTRPDCFTPETYCYLEDLNRRTYLSIELGVQTSHNKTLQILNRGHTWEESVETIEHLAKIKIEVVAHVMLGLPNENAALMFKTAKRLSELPVTGIKIHQTMVIAGTLLEEWFKQKTFFPLFLLEYAEVLCGFLERLRPDQQIHRIVADAKIENGLVEPLWSAQKSQSIAMLHHIMNTKELNQGSLYEGIK